MGDLTDPIRHRDSNGVDWQIFGSPNGNLATPDPKSTRQYRDDLTEATDQSNVSLPELQKAIDAFAARHSKDLVLQVTAKKDSGNGLLIAVLVVLFLYESGKRR